MLGTVCSDVPFEILHEDVAAVKARALLSRSRCGLSTVKERNFANSSASTSNSCLAGGSKLVAIASASRLPASEAAMSIAASICTCYAQARSTSKFNMIIQLMAEAGFDALGALTVSPNGTARVQSPRQVHMQLSFHVCGRPNAARGN